MVPTSVGAPVAALGSVILMVSFGSVNLPCPLEGGNVMFPVGSAKFIVPAFTIAVRRTSPSTSSSTASLREGIGGEGGAGPGKLDKAGVSFLIRTHALVMPGNEIGSGLLRD